jgi:hypothetical protein
MREQGQLDPLLPVTPLPLLPAQRKKILNAFLFES